MNYSGSFRKLLGNAKAALIAAIEIYNKPAFTYRDECVVILLLNAWELLLKAILSKNGESIFYPKKRNEPYRTLSWRNAFVKVERYFPGDIPHLPVRRNLELLGTYRDNSVHFYNAKDFGVLIYSLGQTCIMNFRDLLDLKFGMKLEDEISWQLMPLGIKPPIDLVSYLSGSSTKKASSAVRQYLGELARATHDIKEAGKDTGRLLTVFNVKLESVKKIGDADVIVAVKKADGTEGPLAVVRTQDPNTTHPFRQTDLVNEIGSFNGSKFTSHVFQAVAWKYKLKDNPQFCWRAKEGVLTKYSNDVIPFVKRLSIADIKTALEDYNNQFRSSSKRRK